MKAATGELSLTVITIIAVAAVIGFFTLVIWPNIQNSMNSQWDTIEKNSKAPGMGGYIVIDHK